MGMNLQSCCHRCKVRVFHFRGREQETLLPFYNKHYICIKINPENITTREDQIQEEAWMSDYKEDIITTTIHNDKVKELKLERRK